ncbi:hypothetical protein [Nonomuraea turcica]|uniref:hypothetical protein n=1 Tax=Nonomuraea sp. G32 TaxID=3067274 RepID=UPI00273A8386|nr:hypothetical protein [Nonomuraea sp. G32]MDP4510030.1 hypothetical protein [Nonomuraea sp. G32]
MAFKDSGPTIGSREVGPSPPTPHDALYSWTANNRDGHGMCGITDEPDRALQRLNDALDTLAGGASGFVEVVHLDRAARQPSYVHGTVLARRQRDKHDVAPAEAS